MKKGLAWLAMVTPCWGGTMYQIDWAGVVMSASVRGIDHTQTSFTVDIDPGTLIFGTVTFDLGLAPPPVVNTFTGSTQILMENTALNPVWVGGTFTVALPVLPADALPIPSTFDVGPLRRPVNGEETLPSEARQSLTFNYCDGTCSAVLAGARFSDSWRIPGQVTVGSIRTLGLLIASNDAFLPRPPGGPVDFTATNLSGGSIFGSTQFTADLTNPTPPLFGIRENYAVGGTFTLTEATGRFIVSTPEPATWILGLAGLAAVVLKRVTSSRPQA